MDIIMIIMIINVITLIMIIIITGAISATHKVHQCLHGLMPLITDQRLATQHAPFFDLKGVDGDHSDVNGVCWADDNVDAASADDDLRVYNDDLRFYNYDLVGDNDDLFLGAMMLWFLPPVTDHRRATQLSSLISREEPKGLRGA